MVKKILNSLIMIIDDNPDILLNIKLMLEYNEYEVVTAENGKDALEKLDKLDKPPNLFICDIMMPEMDGYEFFELILDNDELSNIPFIFLTAKSEPEDVRLGKMLGVDDYITKPFKQADLLAIISGKLQRRKRINSINNQINELFTSLNGSSLKSVSEEDRNNVIFIFVLWDEKIGPKLEVYHPKDINVQYSLEDIGTQVFQMVSSIYGKKNIKKSQGFLLTIENINKKSYVYFDSYEDEDVRGNERRYMLALIANEIKMLSTFRIKEYFNEISTDIKNKRNWEIENYWEDIIRTLK
ncbi:MAG: response regulator [Candidatus Lokiarchaeota archaeon]|nr:response regulator [Candidatus Lokiarchaeota archaeon]